MPGVRLGIDVGTVRIGVARCDAAQLLAVPVETVPNDERAIARIVHLAGEFGASLVYVGDPVSLRGSDTASTGMARDWAAMFAAESGIATHLVDERLTTATATQALRATGRTTRQSRDLVDQAAAIVLLEQALAIEKRSGAPAGNRVRGSHGLG